MGILLLLFWYVVAFLVGFAVPYVVRLRSKWLTALAVMVLAAGCVHQSKPKPVGLSGTIGYASSEDGRAVAVLIFPATGRVRRLHLPETARDRISLVWYDGTRIWTIDAGGVSVLSSSGSVKRRISIKPSTATRVIGNVTWSPDGKRLVYTDGSGLFVIAVSGGKPRLLVAGDDLAQPDWSPDTEKIVLVRGQLRTGSELIQLVDTSTGALRTIAHGFDPDISPDGRTVAYAKPDGVYVVAMSGERPRLVVQNAAHPEWSPDGRYIAFTRDLVFNAGCSTRVFVRNVEDDGTQRALGPRGFEIGPLFWRRSAS